MTQAGTPVSSGQMQDLIKGDLLQMPLVYGKDADGDLHQYQMPVSKQLW